MENTRIMAIGAHPDDIEFLFGGTLAHLSKKVSNEIYIITICNGDLGSADLDPIEIANRRFAEGSGSAMLINAQYDCCNIPDRRLMESMPLSRNIIIGQIRQFRPHIVLTHSPNDNYQDDHSITSLIVSNAAFSAHLPNYDPTQKFMGRKVFEPRKRWEPRYEKRDIRTRGEIEKAQEGYQYKKYPTEMPALYYGDPFPGYDSLGDVQRPSFVVDITLSIDKKIEMLQAHKSQHEWLKVGHGEGDYILMAKRWNQSTAKRWWEPKKGGLYGSSKFAEAFLRHQGTPFNKEPLLEHLLDSYVHIVECK